MERTEIIKRFFSVNTVHCPETDKGTPVTLGFIKDSRVPHVRACGTREKFAYYSVTDQIQIHTDVFQESSRVPRIRTHTRYA